MEKSIIDDISKKMVSRYSDRYKALGYDVKTLGWGSKEQQVYRFQQVLSADVGIDGKSVLDIGCGFGDLAKYFLEQNAEFSSYLGWDINPDLVAEASGLWKDSPNVRFEVRNLATLEKATPQADIGVMLGVLNLNLKGQIDNFEYSRQMITTAYQLVNRVLVVDFLSSRHSPDYPPEDFVYYHDPGDVLEFALSLSSNVVLRHNYAPIPQKEFMVLIYK